MLRRLLGTLLALALTLSLTGPVLGAAPASAKARDGREDSVYPSKGDAAIDVRRYVLNLTWRTTRQRLAGDARLRVRAVDKAKSFTLDLHPALKVRGVRVQGTKTRFRHRGKSLVIRKRMRPGKTYSVRVRYSGHPRTVDAPTSRVDVKGLGWHSGRSGQVWTRQTPFGAYTWYPVNDAPFDPARYVFKLDVPAPWVGVANGTLKRKSSRKGRTHTKFVAAAPLSPHLVNLAIGPYQRVKNRTKGQPPIDFWVPGGKAKIYRPLKYTPGALRWLRKRLGRYPFGRLSVIVTPGRSTSPGQTLIALGAYDYRYGGQDVQEQVLHALAQQWYGASVTPRDWRDQWMSEGIPTFLQAKYTVHKGWRSKVFWKREFARNDQYWRIIYGPPGDYYANEFGQRNVRYCTALMLERLKKRMGPKRFATLMRAWPQSNAHSLRNRRAYVRAVEKRAGDQGRFFARWLNGVRSRA